MFLSQQNNDDDWAATEGRESHSAYVHKQHPVSQSSPWWVFSDTPLWHSAWKVLRNGIVLRCGKFSGKLLMGSVFTERVDTECVSPHMLVCRVIPRYQGMPKDQTHKNCQNQDRCYMFTLWADSFLKWSSEKYIQTVVGENRQKLKI